MIFLPPEIVAVLLLCLYAATTDIRRLEIDNWVSVAIIALFVLYAATTPGVVWVGNVVIMLLILCLGVVLNHTGIMGGGDIKLLTALSLWAGLQGLPALLMGTSLAGALVALATMALRKQTYFTNQTGLAWIDHARTDTPHVAYGIAICAGAFCMANALAPTLTTVTTGG